MTLQRTPQMTQVSRSRAANSEKTRGASSSLYVTLVCTYNNQKSNLVDRSPLLRATLLVIDK